MVTDIVPRAAESERAERIISSKIDLATTKIILSPATRAQLVRLRLGAATPDLYSNRSNTTTPDLSRLHQIKIREIIRIITNTHYNIQIKINIENYEYL